MITLGLSLIALAWLLQLSTLSKKGCVMHPFFLLFYILGTAILVLEGLKATFTLDVVLNAVSLLFAALVLWKTYKK